jgi:hypothetical protein
MAGNLLAPIFATMHFTNGGSILLTQSRKDGEDAKGIPLSLPLRLCSLCAFALKKTTSPRRNLRQDKDTCQKYLPDTSRVRRPSRLKAHRWSIHTDADCLKG